VVAAFGLVGNITFICLKVPTQSAKKTKEEEEAQYLERRYVD